MNAKLEQKILEIEIKSYKPKYNFIELNFYLLKSLMIIQIFLEKGFIYGLIASIIINLIFKKILGLFKKRQKELEL